MATMAVFCDHHLMIHWFITLSNNIRYTVYIRNNARWCRTVCLEMSIDMWFKTFKNSKIQNLNNSKNKNICIHIHQEKGRKNSEKLIKYSTLHQSAKVYLWILLNSIDFDTYTMYTIHYFYGGTFVDTRNLSMGENLFYIVYNFS